MGRADGAAAEAGWSRHDREGLRFVACDLLSRVPGVGHAFSTRRATLEGEPEGGFDLGREALPDAPFEGRRRRLCRAAGLGDRLPLPLRQVHGAMILEPSPGGRAAGAADPPPEADGVLSLRGEATPWVAGVRTADCVPVLLADRGGRAVAAVHAGWRGAAAGIVGRTVARLRELGLEPSALVAALGPSIGPCCYAVGPEVLEAVEAVSSPALPRAAAGRTTLDLAGSLRRQLVAAGLGAAAIATAPWCTFCREDLFFSHRRDGVGAGRMMAVIGWETGPRLTARGR